MTAHLPETCELCRFKHMVPPRYSKYDVYSENQKPHNRIKILFIAESPPNPTEAEETNLPYIYNPNYFERGRGGLLRALDPANPNLKVESLEDKRELLARARQPGYSSPIYLLDAARCPVNQLDRDPLREKIVNCCANRFLYDRIRELDKKPGIDHIIIVKSTVYQVLRRRMRELFEGKFVDVELPFPNVWWKRTFTERLGRILADLGYSNYERTEE